MIEQTLGKSDSVDDRWPYYLVAAKVLLNFIVGVSKVSKDFGNTVVDSRLGKLCA